MLYFSRLEPDDPPESFAPAEAVAEFWDENSDSEEILDNSEPESVFGVIELTPIHLGGEGDI